MPTLEDMQLEPGQAVDAYLDSSDTPARHRFNRRALIFTAIGVAAYALTLIATIPAQVAVPLPGAAGTIWHGDAPLDGGNRVEWRWAPLRSLFRFGFAADFTVTGADTALAGRALLRPGRVMLDSVSGSADGALLTSIAHPSFSCTVRMQVDLKQVDIGGSSPGAEGRVQGDPGICQAFGGTPPVAIPALTFDLRPTPGLTVINLAPTGQARSPFIVGGLSDKGILQIIVTAEGATALPFASTPGGMKVEIEL